MILGRTCVPAVAGLLVALVAAGAPASGDARVLENPEEALRSAFPEAERFEPRDVLLTPAMVERIERLARARVKERMVTFYTARKGAAVVGYAAIHSHVVRTKRETITVAFEPDGRLRQVEVIAFFEPPEYRPPERWLAQFEGKTGADRLAVGDDLAPISGATLSARGIAEQARWLLQAFRVAIGEGTAP